MKALFPDAPKYVFSQEAEEILGFPGAMLSGSKVAPEGETVYWNACVFNSAGEQIWHGDLNITKRAEDLQWLADQLGCIYVTPEHPYRSEGLKKERKKDRRSDRVLEFSTRRDDAS